MVDGTYDDAVAASAALAADDVLVVSDTSWDGYVDVPADVIAGYATIFAEVDEQLGGDDARPRRRADGRRRAHRRGRRALLGARRGRRGRAVRARRAGCASARPARRRSCPDPHDSIMAGLNCGTVSLIAWPTVLAGVDVFVAVDDAAAEQAMRDLAALGVVAGETGAASLAGLRALVAPRRRGRRSTCAAAGRWCCAPRAPPTPSPTNASWARPRRLTYGERSTRRRAQGEDDRGVQPVRPRHPDQPVPGVPVAARRSARVPERGDRVLGPLPLRRRARRAPRPRAPSCRATASPSRATTRATTSSSAATSPATAGTASWCRGCSRRVRSPTSSPRCATSPPACSTARATRVRSTSSPSSPPTCR